jgi:putative Mg2+ transporter-C (MgtC) family protein
MSTQITWSEIALRLLLTLVAGALIGINRGEHGHPAGLRTTMLVCLAASISMIQVNLLLDISGKSPSSFVVMDLMRLPLGILSGMGFIGAGAILRKENLVTGVTTAATLWFVTVMGLCLGGGQLVLGTVALILGLAVLWGLKTIEMHWYQDRLGTLTVICNEKGPGELEISRHVGRDGARILNWSNLSYRLENGSREHSCRILWRTRSDDPHPPGFLKPLSETPGIVQLDWKI